MKIFFLLQGFKDKEGLGTVGRKKANPNFVMKRQHPNKKKESVLFVDHKAPGHQDYCNSTHFRFDYIIF